MDWEIFILCCTIYGTIVGSCANTWYMPLLFGVDPLTAYVDDQAAGGIISGAMCIAVAVSGISMYIPIRVCVLWTCPLLGTSPFMIMLIVFDSPFSRSWASIITMFMMLSFMSVQGAHRNEKVRRLAWRDMERLKQSEALIQDTSKQLQQAHGVVHEQQAQIHDTTALAEQRELRIREHEATIHELQNDTLKGQERMQRLQNNMQHLHLEIHEREAHIRELQNTVSQEREAIHVKEVQINLLEDYLQEQQREIDDKLGPLPDIIGEPRQRLGKKSIRAGNARGSPFNGHWILISGGADMWLHWLHIQGSKVTLGDGSVAWLRWRGQEPVLEGGTLCIEGGILYRTGKSKTVIAFKRFHPVAAVQTTRLPEDDRLTVISDSDVSTTSTDSDVANMSDLDDSSCSNPRDICSETSTNNTGSHDQSSWWLSSSSSSSSSSTSPLANQLGRAASTSQSEWSSQA